MKCCKCLLAFFLVVFLPVFAWLLACDALYLPSFAVFDGDHSVCVRPRVFLMRFFRDLSRSKARRRLHTESSLVTLMMGNEELLTVRDHEDSGDGTSFTMTAEELSEMNGEDGKPLYLAIRSRIYDVSKGESFYGKGRSYHHFVARDASRAFATNCKQPACLVPSLLGLSQADRKEIDRWVELYEFHDKYTYVGKLVQNDPVNDAVEQALLEEQVLRDIQRIAEEQGENIVEVLVKKGKEAYRKRDIDLAVFMWSATLTRLGSKTEGGFDRGGDDGDDGGDGGDGESSEELLQEQEMAKDTWVTAMLKRAQILGYIAAAVQKRGSINDMQEAMDRFSESAASMKRLIEEGGSRLTPCVLAKAWFMRSSSEADHAAVQVMSKKQKDTITGGDASTDVIVKRGVNKFKETLLTYSNGYKVALSCEDGGVMTNSLRTGWINANINLAHAYKNIGKYKQARLALQNILDETMNTPTVISKADVENSKVLSTLKQRANGLDTKILSHIAAAEDDTHGRTKEL
jgi:predicted heme/steroid binding protein